MSSTREEVIFEIKVVEQAERYQEMVQLVKDMAIKYVDLTGEERNLLSLAFKNIIGVRRAAWRILCSLQAREMGKMKGEDSKELEVIIEYKATVEKELDSICQDILTLLDGSLIPKVFQNEAAVYYHKMKGDYLRYKAEYKDGSEKQSIAEEALVAYKNAYERAAELASTDPVRLGLALNFSVFYYEILDQPKNACELANSAFDGAMSDLNDLSENEYKDSALIMQLLRDNLALWTADQPLSRPIHQDEDAIKPE